MNLHTKGLRTRSSSKCYLCSSGGKTLYEGLRDRIFTTPGEWNLQECLNPDCGLLWLNPVPLEKEIGKAYQIYYTHADNKAEKHETRLTRFVRWNIRWIYDLIKIVTLIRYKRKQHNLMYLDKMKPGKLLEVGCGSGRRLSRLRDIGWIVEGQEVDPKAASNAGKRYGLTVHVGGLASLSLKEDMYDAIILNHVVEHVHDPVSLLSECHRLLKRRGMLVAITPNVKSYGHRRFGKYWRDLDPPRHLYLFSQRTLQQTATRSGFNKIEIWTSAVKEDVIAMGSLDIKYYGKHIMNTPPKLNIYLSGIFFQVLAMFIHSCQPDSGEECVLRAVK